MRRRPAVIIADEDKDVRFLIKIYLRDYEIDVLEARDGQECIGLIRDITPVAAVVNFVLGDISGYQTAETVYNEGRGTPLILMTLEGFDLFLDRPGVSEYLVKPFSRGEFLEVLDKSMGGKLADHLRRESLGGVSAGEAPGRYKSSGKKILVADDEENILKLYELLLEGYGVDFAGCGEELIEKASSSEYDLIISDVIMPGLSGWKAVAALRDKGINTPVIFSSGLVRDLDLYETLRPSGVSTFILKPFKREDILSAVEGFLSDPAG